MTYYETIWGHDPLVRNQSSITEANDKSICGHSLEVPGNKISPVFSIRVDMYPGIG